MEYNPFLPEYLENPYPMYHRLRAEDPVHRSALGFWVLSRYDDVVTVLRDPRFGREAIANVVRDRELFQDQTGPARSMLFRDPPDHTRLRSLVQKAFTPRVVEGLRPRVQAIVDGLLDEVTPAGTMDVIADVAYPLPVIVICEMLGVPASDRDAFKGWSLDVARSLDALVIPAETGIVERGVAARRAFGGYFRALIAERRRRPRPDLLSALIAAEEEGDKLSEAELLATCILLFVAGHETTVNLIGNGLLALLCHPAELARLRDDPKLAESAVEELLRYDGPVQRTGRVAKEDVVLDGHKIAAGELVLALVGAANRDPAHFREPDRLDVARADNRHIAFGWGIHFCLGASLARLEAQITLATLLRRMPRLRLQSETAHWRPTSVLRGLADLPVAF